MATTTSITGLFQGSYDLTVTNSDGSCPFIASSFVDQPTQLVNTIISDSTNCNGLNDGLASVNVSGGTSPYIYSWSNGQTSISISGLTANNYSVTIIDNNLCSDIASVTIYDPSPVLITVSPTNVNCNGQSSGQIAMAVQGGTSPYTYQWNNGSTNQNISGLLSGIYIVTVADDNLCQGIMNTTITEPSALSVSFGLVSITCNGGTNGEANATALGGASGYTYLWENGETSSNNTGLSGGITNITVEDALSCTSLASVTINEPLAISISAATIDAACGNNNGSALLSSSGGNSGYTYLWQSGFTGASQTGLDANLYFVTVSDVNLCSTTTSFAINNPNPIITITGNTSINCSGGNEGNLTIDVSGGTTGYSFSWFELPSLQSIPSTDVLTTSSITGLSGGIYGITIIDSSPAPNGPCQVIEFVTITEPSPITIAITETNSITCYNDSDGALTSNVAGGASPYTYSWSNLLNTSSITGINAGLYVLTVTDNNGCSIVENYNINQPNQVVSPDTITSCNTIDNVISLNGSPISGSWSSADPLVTFVGTDSINIDAIPWSTPGNPYLLYYDVAGCIDSTYLIVNGANAGTDTMLCGSNSTLTIPGPISPAGGIWTGNNLIDPIAGQIDLTGLNGTNQYVYTNNGCPDTMNVNITPNPISPSIEDINICFGDSILFTTSPGNNNVLWFTDSLLNNLASTDTFFTPTIIQYDTQQVYYVIYENNGCNSSTTEITANIGDSLSASFIASTNSGTAPLFVQFNNVSSGVDPNLDQFVWSFGDDHSSEEFSPEHTFDEIGQFTTQLVVIDYYTGCNDSTSITITTDATSSLTIPIVFSPDGDGINDIFTMSQNNLLTLEVEIHNRWGENVYQWEGINGDWDGRTFTGEICPPGVYYAIITATGLDASGNMYTYGPTASAITITRRY